MRPGSGQRVPGSSGGNPPGTGIRPGSGRRPPGTSRLKTGDFFLNPNDNNCTEN